ncbi:MAG: DUF1835 domain-containing protein [Vicinamibacterales bacterium]
MLHVTNGAVALSRLHDLGLPGRIVPWDDVLHEGPVPAGLDAAALRRVRAEFLAISWGDVGEIEQMLAARDQALAEAAAGDEIVLWFEHDLYDQLHVLQVVDQLTGIAPGLGATGATVTAVLADDYLAAQSDDQLAAWFTAREPLGAVRWAAAATAWTRFRDADPSGLAAFDDPGAWPSLRNAVRRHLQQFPAAGTGLSRTEAQTMAAVAAAPLPVREAFRAANHAVEDAVFMGDAGWWWHIRPLLSSRHPLLRVDGASPSGWHDPAWWSDEPDAPRLALTPDGQRVLAGEADHVTLNGIDRWLGGVHLQAASAETGQEQPRTLWRWNDAASIVARG